MFCISLKKFRKNYSAKIFVQSSYAEKKSDSVNLTKVREKNAK